MKTTEFRKLIREEVRRVLRENTTIQTVGDLQTLRNSLQKSGNISTSELTTKGGKLHVLTVQYNQPNGSVLPIDLVLDLQWKSPDFQVYYNDGWSPDDPMAFIKKMMDGKQI